MNKNKLTFELFKGKELMKLNRLLWQIFSSEGVCESLGIESFLPWVTHVTFVVFLVVVCVPFPFHIPLAVTLGCLVGLLLCMFT